MTPDARSRVVPYGVDALLVDLPGLAAVRALDDALRADPPPGVVDVVPAARTVLVRFGTPGDALAAADLVAAGAARAATAPAPAPAQTGASAATPVPAPALAPTGGSAATPAPADPAPTATAPTDPAPAPAPAAVVLPVRYD
ncbi:carboxyltransferase domain-containing protein, partial [Cellulomonas sp.]|uniref:carboxyltransferase domain-containing protein n=1 Tax=Cellulomonas sp. TaxID=40001 RepID=UPI002D341B89